MTAPEPHPRGIVLELECATAMFMHREQGAYAQEAELRAPSFKGMARYWFRAAAGPAFLAPRGLDLGKLRMLEAEVFGSTSIARRTAFVVQSHESNSRSSLLPHKNGVRSACFPAGSRFWLSIAPASPTVPSGHLQAALASMWLALHLGGFGQRSRRGAGSLVATARGRSEVSPFLGRLPDYSDLADALGAGLKNALDLIRALAGGRVGRSEGLPRSPMLAPGAARLVVAPLEATSEEKARAEIMLRLRTFKDPVYGLPFKWNPDRKGRPDFDGRHASPLWVHLHPLTGGGFAAVCTAMRSATLPMAGNWAKVDGFLDSLRGREVPVP